MRSTRGFRMAMLLALVVLVPVGAGALRQQTAPFVSVIEQVRSLAIVRTTSAGLGENTLNQRASVELVRSLIPAPETPAHVLATRSLKKGEVLYAVFDRGSWYELEWIVAGRMSWSPSSIPVPRLTAVITSIQQYLREQEEARRAQHIGEMLRSKDPLLQGTALDLLQYRPVVPTDEIYRRVIAMADCDGRFALPAIAQMVKFPVERTLETFQKLVTCELDTVARVAFRAIQGINTACPLELEAVRSPATREEAYRTFHECRDRRAEKYSGGRPRRDVK